MGLQRLEPFELPQSSGNLLRHPSCLTRNCPSPYSLRALAAYPGSAERRNSHKSSLLLEFSHSWPIRRAVHQHAAADGGRRWR